MKLNKVVKIYADFDRNQECNLEFYGKDSLSSAIKGLQTDIRSLKNTSMRMCYDYDQNQYSYYKYIDRCKQEIGLECYPKVETKDFSKYPTLDGYLYDALKNDYPNLGSGIISSVIRRIFGEYNNDKQEIISGCRSLRTYGKNQPILIRGKDCKLQLVDQFDYMLSVTIFSKETTKNFGMKRGGVRFILKERTNSEKVILDRILNGEYKLCECLLAYDSKRNHKTKIPRGWYFCISYSFEKDVSNPGLDANKILGVDLGISNVLYLGWSGDEYYKRYIPGSEIRKFQRIEEQRKSDIQRSRVTRGSGSVGHGVHCAIKPLERQDHYIHNFKENKNWHYAHFVIDEALRGGFGTIQMENLSGITKSEKLDRAWTFYSLQQKIEQLAKENGIKVRKINPEYTSQMCSRCGYISSENRKTQANFKCIACNYRKNADHNAAINISKKNIEQLIIDQKKLQNL